MDTELVKDLVCNSIYKSLETNNYGFEDEVIEDLKRNILHVVEKAKHKENEEPVEKEAVQEVQAEESEEYHDGLESVETISSDGNIVDGIHINSPKPGEVFHFSHEVVNEEVVEDHDYYSHDSETSGLNETVVNAQLKSQSPSTSLMLISSGENEASDSPNMFGKSMNNLEDPDFEKEIVFSSTQKFINTPLKNKSALEKTPVFSNSNDSPLSEIPKDYYNTPTKLVTPKVQKADSSRHLSTDSIENSPVNQEQEFQKSPSKEKEEIVFLSFDGKNDDIDPETAKIMRPLEFYGQYTIPD